MGDEGMLMDFHQTLLALEDAISKNDLSLEDRTDKMFEAVQYVFRETGDQDGYDVLKNDLLQRSDALPGSINSICKNFLIPQLILKLMYKFRRSDRNNIRLDVVKILHDFLYHDGMPPASVPPPPSTPPPPEIEIEQHFQCIVCQDRRREVILGACGHCILCKECYWKMKDDVVSKQKCPNCRKAFGPQDYEVTKEELKILYDNQVVNKRNEMEGSKQQIFMKRLCLTRAAPSQIDLQELLRRLRGGA